MPLPFTPDRELDPPNFDCEPIKDKCECCLNYVEIEQLKDVKMPYKGEFLPCKFCIECIDYLKTLNEPDNKYL